MIYLDHAATTPVDGRVLDAMRPFWTEKFGNPSSLYQLGGQAKLAVDQSRKNIAGLINARPEEIIFTAGGSESVNLAIFGVARNYRVAPPKSYHLIASAIEHHCVINSFKALAGEGYKISLAEVDKQGLVNIENLKKLIRPQTIFISLMYANNEIGTIEPIAEVGKWLEGLNRERQNQGLPRIIFHTDACQAAGFLNLNVNRLGVDLMTVNGSKIYGPKQSGFLYVKNGVNLKPLIYGGGQESGLRSGTENVAGIVGLAKALELAEKNRAKENRRVSDLRNFLIRAIKKAIPNVLLNGVDPTIIKVSSNKHQVIDKRLPNNINFTINGVEGEALMLYLDAYGISASTASACATGALDPSHVLLAIGRSQRQAKGSIRFSLGKNTTKKQLGYLIKILPGLVKQLRQVKNLK